MKKLLISVFSIIISFSTFPAQAQFNFFFSLTAGCPSDKIKKNGACVSNNNIITLTQPSGGGLALSAPNPVLYDESRTITYTAPVGYVLSSWTGDCSTVGLGNTCVLANIQSNKTVGVTTSCAQGFLFSSVTNTCVAMDSCKTLLSYYPQYKNVDGMYQIVNSDTGATFNAYCDMTTSGGGWTLLFSPDATTAYNVDSVYDANNLIYKGESTAVVSKTVFGISTTLAEQQKAVKSVKFTQLNMFGYALTSSQNSSWATKFINRTSWDYTTGISGLANCTASGYNKWDLSETSGHTQTKAVLACYLSYTSYGDEIFNAIGGWSNKNSAYSCGRNQNGNGFGDTSGQQYSCGVWYLLSSPGHRGGSVFSNTTLKNNMVWGR